MTAIWRNDGSGWKLLAPAGFPDEAALHTLVEQAPHILPLSGSPQLVVVGREVALGSGYADLVAIEPSGRVAIIEIKLARNAEARRAVVSQVMAYAAYLRGMEASVFERSILARHLRSRHHESLAQAIAAQDEQGSFDPGAFAEGLSNSLTEGRFRLVFVLDSAPEELVRLVGYFESITDKLVIDLITVNAYDIGGTQVLVPQRVEPDRDIQEANMPVSDHRYGGQLFEGATEFAASIQEAKSEYQPSLRRLYEWANQLERQGLVTLSTYKGKSGRLTLLPRLVVENVGLVTIWNDNGDYLQFWRSVFERRAPNSIQHVERLIGKPIGGGNTSRVITDELLQALTAAYQEAAGAQIQA